MRGKTNRMLLFAAIALVGAWVLLRSRGGRGLLPWNQGQAGSIDQAAAGAHMGGGQ